MTVHEEYPATHLQLVVDLQLSLLSLATAKTDLLALLSHVHFGCESLKTSVRVSTFGQDED
jgi:hypothetical protein